MRSDDADRWVGIRLEVRPEGTVGVRIADSRGRWDRLSAGDLEVLRVPDLAAPIVISRDLRLAFANRGPWEHPVFVDAPVSMRALPLEQIVVNLLRQVHPEGFYLPVRWLRRLVPGRVFRLPLKFAFVGAGSTVVNALERVKSFSWYRNNEDVKRYGMKVDQIRAAELPEYLSDPTPLDVLFTVPRDLPYVTQLVRGVRAPAVVAVLAEADTDPIALSTVGAPTTHSLMLLPAEGVDGFVLALVHDQPLHEALNAARANEAILWTRVRLETSPEANYGAVRLSDALDPLAAQTERLAMAPAPGDVDAFLERLDPGEIAVIGDRLRRATQPALKIAAATSETQWLAVTYERESLGLVPLSEATARLVEAQQAQPQVDAILAEIAREPMAADAVARHQVRVVDIAMKRRTSAAFLESSETLQRGVQYRLRVHIGAQSEEGLLSETPPSIDPLLPDLPDAAGYQLDVIVFGLDFTLLSEARQTLRLPRLGPSEPVWFDLRAPSFDNTAEAGSRGSRGVPARTRVAIYYGNHLVQSFVVHALVTDEDSGYVVRALHVDLEFSQTERFGNLDELGPRALSLALNDNPDDNDHTLMWKREGKSAEVQLRSDQIKGAMHQFRETLAEAAFKLADEQRFPLDGSFAWDDFDNYVRRLAREGNVNFRGLMKSGDAETDQVFKDLGKVADQPIQVVLHSHQDAFPWASLYDLFPPDHDEEVCLGGYTHEEVANGTAQRERRCKHRPGQTGFCIYGFWGVRHQIEFLLLRQKRDAICEVVRAPKVGSVRLALGGADESWVRPLEKDLPKALGADVVQSIGGDDPLQLLWGEQRPSMLIVLGHFVDAEPGDPAIEFLGSGARLRTKLIDQQLYNAAKPWQQPYTIVLLMACGSAAAPPESLVTMVKSFASAPAGAIVGTETAVVPTLVSRFAADVTTAIWNGASFGAAMTEARRELLRMGNPLGFAFTGYGNVDLRLSS